MYSSRMPRYRTKGGKAGQKTVEKKKKVKKKPEWDDTINDLDAHKATPEEMARRQMKALSNNLEMVRQERLRKRISKASAQNRTPNSSKKKRNFLTREVLYDTSQLEDVLAKSDRAMRVVKDLFGDDPGKFRSVPNVTIAPTPDLAGLKAALNNSLPNSSLEPSKLDILSESVMDRTALNDMDDTESDTDSELGYEPQIDVDRFKRLLALAEAESKKTGQKHDKRSEDAQVNQITRRLAQGSLAMDHPDLHTPNDSPRTSPRVTAINDTGKCQRTMARTDHRQPLEEEKKEESLQISNMEDLKKVLDGLESNISDYERLTGREPAAQRLYSNTFSGYTVGLIDAVTRMTTYLKESEIRLRAECTLREQLAQDVGQTRTLVDALTSDIIATQEEYAKLQSEFLNFKNQTSQQMIIMKTALDQRGISMPPVAVPPKYPAQSAPLIASYPEIYPPVNSYVGSQQAMPPQVVYSQYQGLQPNVQAPVQHIQHNSLQNQPPQPQQSRLVQQHHQQAPISQPQQPYAQTDLRDEFHTLPVPQNRQPHLMEQTQQSAPGYSSAFQPPQRPPPQQQSGMKCQEEIANDKHAAYLLSPPKQMDSPQAGSSRPAPGPAPSAGASRSLQFDQPQANTQQRQHSAFASYIQTKQVQEPVIHQRKGHVDIPSVHHPSVKPSNLSSFPQTRDPLTGLDEEGRVLLQQIEELNRQHEAARDKLQTLRETQVISAEKEQIKDSVSPSISPIPHEDSNLPATTFPKQTNIVHLRTPREIRVSLPKTDG